MTPNSSIRIALVLAMAGVALAACDREASGTANGGSATVGQKIDRALDRTQKELAQAGEKISAATDRAKEKTREAANDVKNTTYERGPAPGEKANGGDTAATRDTRATLGDAAITASIKTDFLKDPDLSVLKIDVDTRDGVVTLNGLAENEEARQRAEKMAGAVKGVREVRNHLTVKRT